MSLPAVQDTLEEGNHYQVICFTSYLLKDSAHSWVLYQWKCWMKSYNTLNGIGIQYLVQSYN